MGAGDVARIIKVPLSSDWGLQPDPMKLDYREGRPRVKPVIGAKS